MAENWVSAVDFLGLFFWESIKVACEQQALELHFCWCAYKQLDFELKIMNQHCILFITLDKARNSKSIALWPDSFCLAVLDMMQL